MKGIVKTAIWGLVLITLAGSPVKEKAFYLNYDRSPNLGVVPGFAVKHSVLLMEDGASLLCGTTADSAIFVAHLDEQGEPTSPPNLDFGPGSAHEIIPLPAADNDAFLMLANQGDCFLSIILNSLGQEVERYSYRPFFETQSLFSYARAYAATTTNDGGFLFTGIFNQTTGSSYLFALKVDQNHQEVWLRIYHPNTYGLSIQQVPDGYIVISAIKPPHSVLMVVEETQGDLLVKNTLFQTAGSIHNEILYKSDNTFVFAGTRQWDFSTDMLYLEFSFDGSNIQMGRELSLGESNASEYGYRITPSQDGGYIILGVADYGGMGLVFQKVNSDGSEGWREYYAGGEMEYPGDVFQFQEEEDLGFFGFGIVEAGGETTFHFVKTDEVGRIEQ